MNSYTQISRGSFYISQGGHKVGWVFSWIDPVNGSGVEIWILNTKEWADPCAPNPLAPDCIVKAFHQPDASAIPVGMVFTYLGEPPTEPAPCQALIDHLRDTFDQCVPPSDLKCHTSTIVRTDC